MRVAAIALAVVIVCTATRHLLASPPVLQVGGQPYFPLGWYDSRGFGSSAAAMAGYAEYPSAGMNTVLFAYGSWSNQGPAITSALEGASANGLKLMFEIDRNVLQQQPGYPISLIDEQVDLAKSHPALLGYYLIDEPEWQGVNVATLQDRYAQVKNRDAVHPIFVAHSHTTSYLSSEPPPYMDVLMSDTYMVHRVFPEFGDELWVVAQHARIMAQQSESQGKQAYINIVQAHSSDPTYTGFRPPTFGEQRYISYAPIVQGARGLLWWMHYYTTQDYRTNVVGPIASEIESLVPAIISNSTAVSVSSDRDGQSTHGVVGDISYLFGQDETGGYLIAVNNTASAFSVQFTLEGDWLLDIAPVLSESRTVTLQDLGSDTRKFTDSFGPFDVNVYRIAVPEPAAGTLLMVPLGMALLRRGASNHRAWRPNEETRMTKELTKSE